MKRTAAERRPIYDQLTALAEQELETGRRTASRMTSEFPRWVVMFGAASRRFWAFPLWENATCGRLEHANPNNLAQTMRTMEVADAQQLIPTSPVTPAEPVARRPGTGDWQSTVTWENGHRREQSG